MDRTAWIVVSLCTLGLIGWSVYGYKQQLLLRQQQVVAMASPTPAASPSASAATTALPAPSATPQTQPTPAFAEKTETLRNDDVELHLTNRGGGIREAVLLNQVRQGNDRVTLNSKDLPPIGAMFDQPIAPTVDEFILSRETDGGVKCEHTADNVTVRKKFFFPPSKEKKDNFVAEMDVDLVNGGTQPYTNPGYFVALGSAAPIHPKDYPTTRVWFGASTAKRKASM
jgi:YidC/Oxa1 family membrane protein insertase